MPKFRFILNEYIERTTPYVADVKKKDVIEHCSLSSDDDWDDYVVTYLQDNWELLSQTPAIREDGETEDNVVDTEVQDLERYSE